MTGKELNQVCRKTLTEKKRKQSGKKRSAEWGRKKV